LSSSSAQRQGDYIIYKFGDNGIDIPSEYKERVFDLFELPDANILCGSSNRKTHRRSARRERVDRVGGPQQRHHGITKVAQRETPRT